MDNYDDISSIEDLEKSYQLFRYLGKILLQEIFPHGLRYLQKVMVALVTYLQAHYHV